MYCAIMELTRSSGYAEAHATPSIYTRGSTVFRGFGWKVVELRILKLLKRG